MLYANELFDCPAVASVELAGSEQITEARRDSQEQQVRPDRQVQQVTPSPPPSSGDILDQSPVSSVLNRKLQPESRSKCNVRE